MTQTIVDEMKQLGFTEYEVKAYLALLKQHPTNGYNLSRESGIPRSRIYDVLKSLQDKQAVFEKAMEKTALYYPVDPSQMLDRLRLRYQQIFLRVEEHARELYTAPQEDNRLVTLVGQRKIIEFLQQAIEKARERIDLAIWQQELDAVQPELNRARERGVVIKGIFYGDVPCFELVAHRRIERYLEEKNQRSLMAVMDRQEVMYGIISRGDESQVTWTRDQGFVDMAMDFIVHDLIVNRYSSELSAGERQAFEDFTDRVRAEYA